MPFDFFKKKAPKPHDPVAVTDGPTGQDRTVFADAARVKAEIARLPPKIWKMMKQAALHNPIVSKDVGESVVGPPVPERRSHGWAVQSLAIAAPTRA